MIAPEPEVIVPEGPRIGRVTLAVVAVVAMVVGAAAATGVLLVTGLPGQPVHRFTVNVFLDPDVTAEQKAAVEAALPAFKPSGDIEFVSRDEAWRRFQETFEDYPDLLEGARAEDLPESYTFVTTGRVFDCAGYAMVRHLPGVYEVQVIQRVNDYVATITCGAEDAQS